MKPLILAATLGLAACSLSPDQTKQVQTVLDQLGNTAVTDLETAQGVAMAATPPDQAGADCAGAAIKVAQAIQKLVAASAGKNVGAFTLAEIASIYQPGSAQWEYATTTIEAGCLAKAKAVNEATMSGVGILLSLPTLVSLAAPILA